MDLDIRVLEGSRALSSEGNVKYSYHLVGGNLVFASNTKNGPMNAFVKAFEDRLMKEKPAFLPCNDDGSPRNIIDMSVYSKNRVLRTALSCKLSDATKTPLKLLPPWDGRNDLEGAFVTNIVPAGQHVFTMQDINRAIPATSASVTCLLLLSAGAKKAAGSSAMRARGGNDGQAAQAPVPNLPSDVLPQLQALLDAAGSRGCQVKQGAGKALENGMLSFPCVNVGTRECLVCEGVTHVSNNASLNVGQDGRRVYYKCLALDCCKEGYKYIGALKPEVNRVLYSASASAGQPTSEMEAEGDMELDFPCIGDQDASDCASEAASSSTSSKTDPLLSSLPRQIIRELALMPKAANEAEVHCTLSLAAQAAWGQTEDVREALEASALEWVYRSLSVRQIAKYANKEELFRAFQGKVRLYFALETCISGCLDALAKLRSARLNADDWFRYRPGAEPYSNGYNRNMAADVFTRRLDPDSTHALSLVLAARILWPMEQEALLHCIRFKFVRSKVNGLEDEQAFEKVWNLEKDASVDNDFKESIMDRMHIMLQPFLRDTIPSVMNGSSVSTYNISTNTLSFWLNSVVHAESCVEYVFDFRTGDITSSKGEGIIRQLYGVKRFFKKDDNINAMADMLAQETDIRSKLRFDSDDEGWRILDNKDGVWKHPRSETEPQLEIGTFVELKLRPLQQLEEFFGKEIVWEDKSEIDDVMGGEGEETDIAADESASQVGSKRSRNTSSLACKLRKFNLLRKTRLSLALYRFAQTPKNQAEILKVLQKSLVVSFIKTQKTYVLCCPNGLVNLMTGELMGKPKPDDFIKDVCSTPYDPNVDIFPAEHFFRRLFPLGAYPDQQNLVTFFQKFLGYGLTLENDQQFGLCIYGSGSNGKSVVNKMLQLVLGDDICKVIPYESLLKARGQNNDALDDAKRARMVTMEEINDSSKEPNSATFKNLVTGDTMTNKSMYKRAKNFTPIMKLVFMLNKLPAIYHTDYAVQRRLAVINFASIFVDEEKALDKAQADELRKRGAPECLIQKKDAKYLANHVRGHEQAFLRFLVLGAVAYYETKHISVPKSMQHTATTEMTKPKQRMYAFVMQRLCPSGGVNTPLDDIEEAFFKHVGDSVNRNTYVRSTLGKHLAQVIAELKKQSEEWRSVHSDQKLKPGTTDRHTVWLNVKLLPPAEPALPAAERFAKPQRPSNGAGSSST